MYKPLVAITVGDPCGIGPEITAKTLADPAIYEACRPLVIADGGLMLDAVRIAKVDLKVRPVADLSEACYAHGAIDVLDLQNIDLDELTYGKITKMGGSASFQYIAKAIELALHNEVDAVTTGPIHKEAINLAGHHYAGHTEIFAELTGTKDYCMMLMDKDFIVTHVTTHVSYREVPDLIKKDRIFKVIRLTHEALKDYGIDKPKIAVAGLNPHAGDGGLFGREEIEEISPAVAEARDSGILVEGPISPDTVFVKLHGHLYHAVVAMYHDQGHIPTKVIGFKYDDLTETWGAVAGINTTLGLPIIRTSVDHGVAFDQAGIGKANPESMIDALMLAVKMAGNKKNA